MTDFIKELDERQLDHVSGGADLGIRPLPWPPISVPLPIPRPRLPKPIPAPLPDPKPYPGFPVM